MQDAQGHFLSTASSTSPAESSTPSKTSYNNNKVNNNNKNNLNRRLPHTREDGGRDDDEEREKILMEEMAVEDFRRVIDVDLVAPYICAKAVIPGMIKKGHGKIINICSMMSELGRETVSAYAAAKGGLKMLTRNICSEFGEHNIQCNGIGPGYIATEQTAPLRERQPDGSRHPYDQFIIAKTPAGRWGTPEDLMGPAVFLASDASNFVNGHVLYVDGGILAYIGKQPK